MNPTKHINLLVDLNNVVFFTRHMKIKSPASSRRKETFVAEKIFKDSLQFIVKKANEFKASAVCIACDSSKVWRKAIYPDYKGEKDYSDPYYEETLEAANMLKQFFRDCTNVSVLEVPHCEADDIIAVAAQEVANDCEIIIMSSDKDFIQLISPSVRLYSPSQGWRESSDPKFDLFVKCIRGDYNDFIPSAYPRVWMKTLEEAWNDDLKMLNLMETVRKDGVKVADAYNFNKSLIDLSQQPSHIRNAIVNEINAPVQRKFGELKIVKWLSDHNLKKYADMLSYKERPLKGFFRLT